MADESRSHTAGVFDIRLVIALLIGGYGAVITIMGLAFTTDADIEKSAGVNINLWAGVGMLAFAAAFVVWTKVRPLKVPAESGESGESGESAEDGEQNQG